MTNPQWVVDVFASIDAMNSNRFASFITEDGDFTFGNAPTVSGRDNIDKFVGGFFAAIKAIRHTNIETYKDGDVLFTRGTVTYTRHNDTLHTVNFLNMFNMKGDLIDKYTIFIDNSELFAN